MTELEVLGGVGGTEVRYDALADTARVLAVHGTDLLLLAADRHRMLLDADLLASALLHPTGVARVEAALLSALDGDEGLTRVGLRLELRSGQLLVAVARYRAADLLAVEVDTARRWLLGATAPVLLPAAGVLTLGWAATVLDRGGDPVAELEQALLDHPGVVEEAAGAVGGLTAPLRAGLAGPLPVLADAGFRAVTGEALLPRDLQEAASLLALLYQPARPRLDGPARPDRHPDAVRVPTGVGDLLSRLDHRDEAARVADGTQGDIGVTRLVTRGPDGETRTSWLVDLPGTKDWQLVPGPRPGINDLASNLELTAGQPTARVEALEQVLRRSGVGADEPVMLVGHSQGGMVAVRAAGELQGRYSITHVVTAGSPVGGMPVPPSVQVLSLESTRDVVPHADGRPNSERINQVTVRFEGPGTTVAGSHGLDTAYAPAGAAVDRSANASVRAWLDGAEVFLAGEGERAVATTTVHSVTGEVSRPGR